MKNDEKFDDVERKIRSLPEPDYDRYFTKDTQDTIHENLMQFASSYNNKKRGAAIMKKVLVGVASVAAFMLFAVLAIPFIEDKLSNSNSNTPGQQTKEPVTIDKNKEENNNKNPADPKSTNPSLYVNTEYGFSFALPKSWEGYQIVTDTWEGISTEQNKVIESGKILLIRHPGWTAENPRQDIPIMIFTLEQWSALEKEEFHIGAAPIGPTKLGENNKYVFALPARYNFAFLEGYEEVETILQNHPLQTKNVSNNDK